MGRIKSLANNIRFIQTLEWKIKGLSKDFHGLIPRKSNIWKTNKGKVLCVRVKRHFEWETVLIQYLQVLYDKMGHKLYVTKKVGLQNGLTLSSAFKYSFVNSSALKALSLNFKIQALLRTSRACANMPSHGYIFNQTLSHSHKLRTRCETKITE